MLDRRAKPPESLSGPRTLEVRRKRGRGGFWLWLAVIILATVGLLTFNFRTYIGAHVHASSGQGETDRAVLAAELAVRNRIDAGFVPRFAPKNWVKVERQGERYVISSWLEAIPKNGGDSTSYDYSCSVFRNSAGDWTVSDINIQLQ